MRSRLGESQHASWRVSWLGGAGGARVRRVPPDLTDEQRAQARERALAARRARADVKRQLALGKLTVADVLDLARSNGDQGAAVSKLRMDEVLLAVPRIGEAKADALLVSAGISGNRRIKGLGRLQRERLMRGLRG